MSDRRDHPSGDDNRIGDYDRIGDGGRNGDGGRGFDGQDQFDPILDACLDELLGGVAPPDLAPRLMASLDPSSAGASKLDSSAPRRSIQLELPPTVNSYAAPVGSNGRAKHSQSSPAPRRPGRSKLGFRRSPISYWVATSALTISAAVACLAAYGWIADRRHEDVNVVDQRPPAGSGNPTAGPTAKPAPVAANTSFPRRTEKASALADDKHGGSGAPSVHPADRNDLKDRNPSAVAGNDGAVKDGAATKSAVKGSPHNADASPSPPHRTGERPNLPTDDRPAYVVDRSAAADREVIATIDAGIARGWSDAKIKPSAKATDAEWCRRVFLAVIGRIPSVDELDAFVGDHSPDKRAVLVDRLLTSDDYSADYARNWTNLWATALVGQCGGAEEETTDRDGLQQYLRRSLAANLPYDRIVSELVGATGVNRPGDPQFNGAVNFLAAKLDENATLATAKTAQVFLGIQIQCTQCHNHPFNDWKQSRFWELNAFFRQTHAHRGASEAGGNGGSIRLAERDFVGDGDPIDPAKAEIYYEERNGQMKVAYPVFPDGRSIGKSGQLADVQRRRELARLIVTSEWMPKAVTNRLWSHFFGHGFTRPVDDMGPHNPPSHPDVLDYASRQFAAGGYNLKSLIRWIALSEAYSLSSRPNVSNKNDDPAKGSPPLFSRYYLRQMRPEQVYESLLVATEAHKTAGSLDERQRLKDRWLRQFTIAYGTDEAMEASLFDGTIGQALEMMNGELVNQATNSDRQGFLRRVAHADIPNVRKIHRLFQAAVARQPTRDELTAANKLLAARHGDVPEALEDVWWVLLNSNEFILDH